MADGKWEHLPVETQLALLTQQQGNQAQDIADIKAELKAIRRGLWVAASTFAVLAAGIFTLIAQQAGG